MLFLLLGCDPYAAWPAAGSYFPYVYTAETDLPPYADTRWETETWTPGDDPDQLAKYIQKAAFHRTSAPVESLQHFATMQNELNAQPGGTSASFVGDIMWLGENWANFAAPAAGLLHGDARVGNLETPTDPAQSTEESALGTYAFNAPVEMYASLPVDILQLTNNHILDAGNSGITATVGAATDRGFTLTGVDNHALVGEIAYLSYTWGLNVQDVTPESELFIVPFGHLDTEIDLSRIESDIKTAKEKGANSIVLLLHWGYEYEYYPDPHFMVLAREMIAFGADVIVGSGPHVAQPAEICHVNRPDIIPGTGSCSIQTADGEARTAAVLYSLGNFGTKMGTSQCQAGLVATVTLDPDVAGISWNAAVTVDGENGRELQPIDALLDDPEWATESTRLDAHLGSGWRD